MYTISNILEQGELSRLVDLIDREIATDLCTAVGKYQSYNYMHTKHADDPVMQKLISATRDITLSGQRVYLDRCWFNVCKVDSTFSFHIHPNTDLSGIFYLYGCNDSGTIFNVNNTKYQILSEDNSLLFFDPNLSHTIPPWKGVDRYTVAFEFLLKK